MRDRRARFLIACALVAGCGGDRPDRCERAVRHLTFDVIATVGPPSPDERRAMELVAAASIERCRREGLSDAELACVLAVRTPADLQALDDCPAIAARRPSWIMF